MTIAIETFKDEIDRAFRVIGADKGFSQNVTDICGWFEDGYLTKEEYKELRKYNREKYHELPI